MKSKIKGFTLIEMLITLALIGILSSIAFMVISGPIKSLFFVQEQIELFNRLDQVSDILDHQLSDAVPQTIKVSKPKDAIIFRKTLAQGVLILKRKAETLNFRLLESRKLSNSFEKILFFHDDNRVELLSFQLEKELVLIDNNQSLGKYQVGDKFRVAFLSPEMAFKFVPRDGVESHIRFHPNKEVGNSLIIGKLSSCVFGWNSASKQINLLIGVTDKQKNEYRLAQQLNL